MTKGGSRYQVGDRVTWGNNPTVWTITRVTRGVLGGGHSYTMTNERGETTSCPFANTLRKAPASPGSAP